MLLRACEARRKPGVREKEKEKERDRTADD
jgi:hypothetical protein